MNKETLCIIWGLLSIITAIYLSSPFKTQEGSKLVIGKYPLKEEIKAKLTVDAPKDRKEFNEWFLDIHNMRNGK